MFDTPVLSCENEKEISEQLANFVVMCYNEAVEERGRFAIALSGGRAVTLLAQRLTEEPFISYVDWTKWYVFFVDERCTSLDNPCSSYHMVDQVLLQHVRIPEMQVYPAYDALLSLDKRGHTCEAAALAYEQRMRSVLGEDNGIPALDVVLVGADADGNVASLFEKHPMTQHKIRNYEVTWGAEGKLRSLDAQQAVCAMYECPLDLYDMVLSPTQMAAAKRRGIPAERVALTLKAINHAHQVLVTVADPDSGPLVKEYFEGPRPGEEARYAARGINLLHGRAGRPKLFAHRKAIDGFIALPQLLRTFQVQDLAFSITEAREAAAGSSTAAAPPPSDSDSEGEEYVRRLEREEEDRLAAFNKSRTNSRVVSKQSSPMGLSPMSPMRRMSHRKQSGGNPSTAKTDKTDVSASIAEGDDGTFSRAASFGRTRSTGSNRSRGKREGHAQVSLGGADILDIADAEEEPELPDSPAPGGAPEEGHVIIPDDFPSLPEAMRHIQNAVRLARGAAARAAAQAERQADALSRAADADHLDVASGPGDMRGTLRRRGSLLDSGSAQSVGSARAPLGRGSQQAAAAPEPLHPPLGEHRIYIRAGCYWWPGVVTIDCPVAITGEGTASYKLTLPQPPIASSPSQRRDDSAAAESGIGGGAGGAHAQSDGMAAAGGGGMERGGSAETDDSGGGAGGSVAPAGALPGVKMEWGGTGDAPKT
jgi:6-phosphogluconolactonase/glucosamine-6-phosphate isomerase/deaminase